MPLPKGKRTGSVDVQRLVNAPRGLEALLRAKVRLGEDLGAVGLEARRAVWLNTGYVGTLS